MLSIFSEQLDLFIDTTRDQFGWVLVIIASLWAFNIVNWMLGKPIRLGVIPRTIPGLFGIIFSPIIHANPNHLFFNSIPLFFLTIFLTSLEPVYYIYIIMAIAVLSGFGVWIIGRRGNHIGASSVITGMFSFILTEAIQSPSIVTIFCGIIALYYFGSILLSLFPQGEDTSWEGHLAGFIAGIVVQLGFLYLL